MHFFTPRVQSFNKMKINYYVTYECCLQCGMVSPIDTIKEVTVFQVICVSTLSDSRGWKVLMTLRTWIFVLFCHEESHVCVKKKEKEECLKLYYNKQVATKLFLIPLKLPHSCSFYVTILYFICFFLSG